MRLQRSELRLQPAPSRGRPAQSRTRPSTTATGLSGTFSIAVNHGNKVGRTWASAGDSADSFFNFRYTAGTLYLSDGAICLKSPALSRRAAQTLTHCRDALRD